MKFVLNGSDILNPPHNGIWIIILDEDNVDEELMLIDEIEVPLSQKEDGNRVQKGRNCLPIKGM